MAPWGTTFELLDTAADTIFEFWNKIKTNYLFGEIVILNRKKHTEITKNVNNTTQS